MKIQFKLNGKDYSKNKKEFKKILKKHGLKWKGSISKPYWKNDKEKVEAEFIRDDEKDITISATLIWEGLEKTEFLSDLKEWCLKFDCEIMEIVNNKNLEIEKKLKFWDIFHKPCLEYLQLTKRPKKWIELDIEKWKRERAKKQKELIDNIHKNV